MDDNYFYALAVREGFFFGFISCSAPEIYYSCLRSQRKPNEYVGL